MMGTGFYEQQRIRPGGLALVIAMHAAAFAALVLVKTTYEHERREPTRLIDIRVPPEQKQDPQERPSDQRSEQPTTIEVVPPIVDTQPHGPIVQQDDRPPLPPVANPGDQIVIADATPELPPPPIRREAQWDPRFAADQQPPYPASEERAQRDGAARVRVTIGPDGRVRAIQCLSATSDAFCRSIERHAPARWRFRPATLDGRPVESSKVISVTFRIEA